MFRTGLLLVLIYSSWYMSCVYVDWLLAGVYADWLLAASAWNCSTPILLAGSQHKRMTHTNCCIYIVVPPDDEQ